MKKGSSPEARARFAGRKMRKLLLLYLYSIQTHCNIIHIHTYIHTDDTAGGQQGSRVDFFPIQKNAQFLTKRTKLSLCQKKSIPRRVKEELAPAGQRESVEGTN